MSNALLHTFKRIINVFSHIKADNGSVDKASEPSRSWYAIKIHKVFSILKADANGLTQEEANLRLQTYGANQIPAARSLTPLQRFLLQFHNLLIYILLASSAVTAMLGHWVDTGVIIAVVLANAVIGFIQEGKAENALKAIRSMLSPQAIVLRDGQRQNIAAEELVPGDVIHLQSGDKVPADVRLFKLKSLQIQESILTGESIAVEKNINAVAEQVDLGDRYCMAYSGTLVSHGQASALVVATGGDTEIGQISRLLERVETLTTPLLRQISQFARWLTLVIIVIAVATFLFGIEFRQYPAAEMFLAAVGLAVAAIPEGLPAIMTITLAIGVQGMARRHAIIRNLPAVETLGSVTVICSDKTGTLTRNEMMVQSVVTETGLFEISGDGYDPHGGFSFADKEIAVDDHPVLAELIRAAVLCNDASLRKENGEWILQGDPTEGSLLTLGAKAGLDQSFEREVWLRTDVIPFESEHRFMATLHHDHFRHGFVYIKGAPERILEMCSQQRCHGEDLPIDHHYWLEQIQKMAQRGQRVLAIAFKNVGSDYRELNFIELETGLTLLGIVGMIDPPREDAIQAVSRCQAAGIRVKMITGDHAVTALAIAKQMGIAQGEKVLTGHEIETMEDEQLRAIVDQVDIFARSSPEHKLRLVEAMQANGHVVAMTGDGVNDAPALKRADVGTAMGQNGTEVAKEAAEMVLADDNFASIAQAVEEGRMVYDNLRKAILFILPTNGGEALTIIAAIVFGRMLPITPVQILWVNMITAVTLALALAFEPAEKDIMQRPPRDSSQPILSGMFIWRIVFVSVILVLGTFGLFIWEREQGVSIETARTIAVNTLVMFEIFYLFSSRYITASVFSYDGFFGNRYALMAVAILIVFQLGFTYL
ncbi:MAG: cation-transporting P-type ATPase, partial [gamma proteobacterium symbiont of Taylorina sp.]|nr:cation-transporting P-type ATPase [gamma proteobacterium symbiont of Taylorina sp.]